VVTRLWEQQIDEGKLRYGEPVEITLKPITFTATNRETGEEITYAYSEETTLQLETLEVLNPDTGELERTICIVDTEEDAIRIGYSKQATAASLHMDAVGNISYTYYIQGYETERYENLLYVIHTESSATIEAMMAKQQVRSLDQFTRLNNRENMVPVFIVFAGALMGFFIVMAYIFLDKDEGVIRAFAVTPSSVWKYLLSKMGVILTTVIVSTSIITIPVMGAGPNYPMLYLFLILSTFLMSSVGLLVASFYDSITKSFGIMYAIMILLMLPAFSYFIPSFDPLWLRFFPSYPMLQGMKEILLNGDIGYALIYSAIFLVGGLLIFLLANIRFKKTLTL